MNRIAAFFCGIALIAGSLPAADIEVPRPAPKLVYNIPGKPPQELSQYLGKVVALEFIFTTCPHCKAASKIMSKLQTEYSAKGLQVLDVAVNPNADLLVDIFAREQQTTFPVGWVLQQEMTSFMGFNDGRYVVPQLVLIDRKGVIRYQTPAQNNDDWVKLMNEDAIRKHVEELLHSTSADSHSPKPKSVSSLR
jgi:thiol-disulfide isomerase/thioredoxin